MKQKTAIKILIAIISTVILFHVCILLKIIPYEFTWGGRLKNDSEMYVFETFSLLINFFFIAVLLIKGHYIKEIISMKIVNIVLWILMLLFGLNTIGNLLAETTLEKYFSILTLLISLLIAWILFKKEKSEI